MKKSLIYFLMHCVLFFYFGCAYAMSQTLSLELKDTNLVDTIYLLAKFLNMNIVISPTVAGVATLSLHDAEPASAFDSLLISQGLAKWRMGNVWYIAPRGELIKRKQEELQWQSMEDESMPLIMQLWQIKYGNAADIAHLLQNDHASLLSKRGSIRVDVRTNMICVQDVGVHILEMNRLIRKLDVPVKQILIEARLASVDNDYEQDLGIHFATYAPFGDNNGQGKGPGSEPGQYSLAVAKLADGSLLDVKLAALENAGHAELISSPRLFTANQQVASIESGEEVPYQEVSESGGTAIVFKKAVLGLRVVPQVLPGNKVLLQLQINQDRPSRTFVLGMPTISTRQMMTHVLVSAGQTVVLGGIYESDQEDAEQRLPFISKVPLLGILFRRQNTIKNRRELLIFVTPKIIA